MEYGFWYLKQRKRYMQDCSVLGAVGPPGGGRSFLPQRFQSKFHTINFTFPDESQVNPGHHLIVKTLDPYSFIAIGLQV